MITQMGRPEARVVSDRALSLLKVLESELGVTVERGSGSIDSSAGVFNMKFVVTAAGADPDQTNFARYAPLFDLTPDHYGRTFMSNGREFRLVGIAPNRPKFPFVAEDMKTGKKFKFTETIVTKLTGARA